MINFKDVAHHWHYPHSPFGTTATLGTWCVLRCRCSRRARWDAPFQPPANSMILNRYLLLSDFTRRTGMLAGVWVWNSGTRFRSHPTDHSVHGRYCAGTTHPRYTDRIGSGTLHFIAVWAFCIQTALGRRCCHLLRKTLGIYLPPFRRIFSATVEQLGAACGRGLDDNHYLQINFSRGRTFRIFH